MLLKLRAFFYWLRHPATVHLAVVRRYLDAQKNFIGELYMGEGREARMIGVSCDNLPFNAGESNQPVAAQMCWRKDFLAPLEPNTVRVGSQEPATNAAVQHEIALRQYCPFKIVVFNRFIEHILESPHVR